jgi:hypothetical protein
MRRDWRGAAVEGAPVCASAGMSECLACGAAAVGEGPDDEGGTGTRSDDWAEGGGVVPDDLAAESTLDSLSVSSCLVAARPAPVTNPRPALLPSTVVAALPIRARLP